ncbi:MAG: hypothetical protein HOO95_02850 [Gallionella sp.]|nr:hypothetical protein [Gallionella sp.]
MKSLLKNIYWVTIILASALTLNGCGGGSDSTPSTTSGSAVSQGVITAKGSVFVNGIEYFSNSSTSITIDGSPVADDTFLKEGMTVKVRGSSDDVSKKGTATKIEAKDALEGKIDSVDNTKKTITVMGQTVQIEDNVTRLNDDNTQKVFSSASFASGDIVEVNGFPDDNGGLHATRVAKKLSGEFESKGFVANLTATSFDLSRTPGAAPFITVNFTSLPAGVVDGSLVEVKATGTPVAGVITASSIRLEDSLGSSGEKVEIEGIVSSLTPGTTASDFDIVINGQHILTDASTLYEGGLSADMAPGVKLEAKGTLNSSGVLVASKISFRSHIKIEGDASAVTATGLTVLGQTVSINALTRLANNVLPVAGAHIEVRAKLDRNGNLIATRIQNRGGSKYFLQGTIDLPASNSAAGTLMLKGITGITAISDGSTQWRTSSSSVDTPVSQAAFFAQLQSASVVKVRWNSADTTLPIKEAEIELGK